MNDTLIIILTVCIAALIVAAHAASVFLRKIGRYAFLVNIPLHVGALALLLILGADLSVAALFVMASLLVYLVFSLIGERIGKREEGEL